MQKGKNSTTNKQTTCEHFDDVVGCVSKLDALVARLADMQTQQQLELRILYINAWFPQQRQFHPTVTT